MIFTPLPFAGAFLIDLESREDARGFFARTVCRDEFSSYGVSANFVQQSVSWNPFKGTLRGLHFQKFPHAEDKLVRVTRGAIFDVVVDLRTDSATYGEWFGVELSESNHRQLYIPKGLAHGFQTLLSETEVLYQMTECYHPGATDGICWNDPNLKICWPIPVVVGDEKQLSSADAQLPAWER